MCSPKAPKKKPEYLPKKLGRIVARKLSRREASHDQASGRVGFRLAFKNAILQAARCERAAHFDTRAPARAMPSVKELAARIERSSQQREAAAAASLSPPRRRRSLGSPGRLGSPRTPAEVLAAAAPRSPTAPVSPHRRRLGSAQPAAASPPRSIRSPGRAPPSPPRRPSVDAALPSPPRRPSVGAAPSPPPPADRAVSGAPADLDARITRRLGELAAARSPSTSPQHKRRPAAPPSPTAKDLVARIERATRERAAAAAGASPPRRRRSLDAAPPSPPRPPPPAAPPAPAPAPARDPTAIARPLLDALSHLEAAKPASPSLLGALWSGFDAAAPPPAPPDPRAPSPPKSLASGGRVGALEAPESLLQFDAHRGRRTSRRRRSSTRDASAAAPVATLPEPVGGLDDDASDVERAAAEDELRLLRHPLCNA